MVKFNKIAPELMGHMANVHQALPGMGNSGTMPGTLSLFNPIRDNERMKRVAKGIHDGLQAMSQQLYADMSKFFAGKSDAFFEAGDDAINYIADAPTHADKQKVQAATHEVLAFTRSQLMDTIKLLAYISYCLQSGQVPNIAKNKLDGWTKNALEVLKESGIPTRILQSILNILEKSPVISGANRSRLRFNAKSVRDSINQYKNKLINDPAANNDMVGLMKALLTYLNSKSESAYKTISDGARHLGDPELAQLLTPQGTILDSHSTFKKHHALLEKLTGRSGVQYLSKDEKEDLSPADQEKHKESTAAANKAYREALQKLVRSSGKATMDVKEVKQSLARMGVPTWRIPTGFDGMLDEKGGMYTKTGEKLASGQIGGWMRMNPHYDPNYDPSKVKKSGKHGRVAEGQGLYSVKPASYYTENWTKNTRTDKKFGQVAELVDKMPKLQKKWRADMLGSTQPKKTLGAMTEALFQTQARLGAAGNKTDGKSTYGLSTLQTKHLSFRQNGSLAIKYPGKKAMINAHVIKPADKYRKVLISHMQKLTNNKKPSDYVWTDSKGKRISEKAVNEYLKTIGFSGTAHKFRHARGTGLFKDLLETKPLKAKASQAEADKYIDNLTKLVGEELGHKRTNKEGKQETVGTTARTSYIDPSIMVGFYRERNLKLPRWLEKASKEK